MTTSATLHDLPNELLGKIVSHLPTAQSIEHLGRASKHLQEFVEKDAWQIFARTKFPSLCPPTVSSHKDAARSLTTVSKAWDRRAFVAQSVQPRGDIRAFPGGVRRVHWSKPRGQTTGFVPQLDCYEHIGPSWRHRKEVLAFSAGAEICVREWRRGGSNQPGRRWSLYRPPGAVEGRDDVTCVHLIRPEVGVEHQNQELIAGWASGGLQLLTLPPAAGSEIVKTSFDTQGLAVRSSSLSQDNTGSTMLSALLGDFRIALYSVDRDVSLTSPVSTTDIVKPQQAGHPDFRAWTINWISSTHLAAGVGRSHTPIHIYRVTPSGLEKKPARIFTLSNDTDRLAVSGTADGNANVTTPARRCKSTVYPVVPLPPASSMGGGSSDGQMFLSGAHSGIIHLHDLRSPRDVVHTYFDPIIGGAIYSLLPRGQEKLLAGTGEHRLVKVFDLRLGAKVYSYCDAATPASSGHTSAQGDSQDWNVFLAPYSMPRRGSVGAGRFHRPTSVYSLVSSSHHSPYIYAGLEGAVTEMAFTSILDPHPDPAFFPRYPRPEPGRQSIDLAEGLACFQDSRTMSLTMHEQKCPVELWNQRGVFATLGLKINRRRDDFNPGLDERWARQNVPSLQQTTVSAG